MRAARPPLPGWLETLRQRLFATPVDIAVSFLCVYVVWRISLPLVDWLLVEANWRGTSREDCTSAGACWVFIRARFAQFMYGQYPVPERWRVDLLGALAVCAARPCRGGACRGAGRRRSPPSPSCRRSASGCSMAASAYASSRRASGAG